MKKTGGHAAQAVGRARGGFSTNIHAGCVNGKTGIALVLTGGERHDLPGCDDVLAQIPATPEREDAMMDKGDERHHIREVFKANAINPVIPPTSNRAEALEYDQDTDKLGETIERFFKRLKQFRRMATRDDELRRIVLACIHIVASYLIVKEFVNTA
jgi:transposase